jgi:signal transduction histidine kinase
MNRPLNDTDSRASTSSSGDDPLGLILARLDTALCRPLAALQVDLERLSGVVGAGVGLDGRADAASRQQVAAMAGLCDELIGLSRAYLDYAAVTRDDSPPRIEPVVMGAIIDQAARPFVATARARGIAWTAGVEGQDAVVWTDARAVAQAIGHVVRNAVEFTPDRGAVRVIARMEPDAATWRVTVSDTGPGIPAELRDRVFRPFVKLPRDVTEKEGCGLGLAACRLLVERLGGSVAIDDAEGGKGIRVSVVLPADPRPR